MYPIVAIMHPNMVKRKRWWSLSDARALQRDVIVAEM